MIYGLRKRETVHSARTVPTDTGKGRPFRTCLSIAATCAFLQSSDYRADISQTHHMSMQAVGHWADQEEEEQIA